MRRRLSSTMVLVCAFGFLVGVGAAEAASKFAYKCFEEGGIPQICVMNSDGTGETQITNYVTGPGMNRDEFSWSPDGTKIAVVTSSDPAGAPPFVCSITVVDAASVMATHLAELIRSHSSELLTREEVNRLLEQLKSSSPKLVEETIGR